MSVDPEVIRVDYYDNCSVVRRFRSTCQCRVKFVMLQNAGTTGKLDEAFMIGVFRGIVNRHYSSRGGRRGEGQLHS